MAAPAVRGTTGPRRHLARDSAAAERLEDCRQFLLRRGVRGKDLRAGPVPNSVTKVAALSFVTAALHGTPDSVSMVIFRSGVAGDAAIMIPPAQSWNQHFMAPEVGKVAQLSVTPRL